MKIRRHRDENLGLPKLKEERKRMKTIKRDRRYTGESGIQEPKAKKVIEEGNDQ